MLEETFRQVPQYDIPSILNILKKNWTENFLLHQYISIMTYSVAENAQLSQVLFCSGDYENGVYFIETKFKLIKDLRFFFIYSLGSEIILKKALMKTNLVPWGNKERYIFEVTLSRFTQTICQVFLAKRVKYVAQRYNLLWLPPNVKVSEKNISKYLFLDNLNVSHAEEIDAQWPSFRNQREVLESEISSFFGLGIFKNTNKQLISYALCFHSGGIFMLFSNPGLRRKGLGDIVTRSMISKIRQCGWVPFCTVFPDNIPSLNLLKQIGFMDYGNADFVFPGQFLYSIL